jgi:hypothetical protein
MAQYYVYLSAKAYAYVSLKVEAKSTIEAEKVARTKAETDDNIAWVHDPIQVESIQIDGTEII